MAWSATGTDVDTSKQIVSSILFSRSGSATIRQVETVETTEVRGMTAAKCKEKVVLSDSTAQTQYYAKIDGMVFSINVTSGSKTEWSGARVDDSGQWVATKRTTTYSTYPASLPSAWSTTPLNANGEVMTLSTGGTSRDVSLDYSENLLWNYAGHPVRSTLKTVGTEIMYVSTEAAANSLVLANTSNTVGDVSLKHDLQYTLGNGQTAIAVGAWLTVKSGVEKFANARYVSAAEGWCVSVTTKTYGYTATMVAAGNTGGWHL